MAKSLNLLFFLNPLKVSRELQAAFFQAHKEFHLVRRLNRIENYLFFLNCPIRTPLWLWLTAVFYQKSNVLINYFCIFICHCYGANRLYKDYQILLHLQLLILYFPFLLLPELFCFPEQNINPKDFHLVLDLMPILSFYFRLNVVIVA